MRTGNDVVGRLLAKLAPDAGTVDWELNPHERCCNFPRFG